MGHPSVLRNLVGVLDRNTARPPIPTAEGVWTPPRTQDPSSKIRAKRSLFDKFLFKSVLNGTLGRFWGLFGPAFCAGSRIFTLVASATVQVEGCPTPPAFVWNPGSDRPPPQPRIPMHLFFLIHPRQINPPPQTCQQTCTCARTPTDGGSPPPCYPCSAKRPRIRSACYRSTRALPPPHTLIT